jgi:hypothetical protein
MDYPRQSNPAKAGYEYLTDEDHFNVSIVHHGIGTRGSPHGRHGVSPRIGADAPGKSRYRTFSGIAGQGGHAGTNHDVPYSHDDWRRIQWFWMWSRRLRQRRMRGRRLR